LDWRSLPLQPQTSNNKELCTKYLKDNYHVKTLQLIHKNNIQPTSRVLFCDFWCCAEIYPNRNIFCSGGGCRIFPLSKDRHIHLPHYMTKIWIFTITETSPKSYILDASFTSNNTTYRL
jgi:hypothetical protein